VDYDGIAWENMGVNGKITNTRHKNLGLEKQIFNSVLWVYTKRFSENP
jgi:hypothetical protein